MAKSAQAEWENSHGVYIGINKADSMLYLHAGLLPEMANERVHLGRGRRPKMMMSAGIGMQSMIGDCTSMHPVQVKCMEPDPLTDEQGRFVKRQYLGKFGNEQQSAWFVIDQQLP